MIVGRQSLVNKTGALKSILLSKPSFPQLVGIIVLVPLKSVFMNIFTTLKPFPCEMYLNSSELNVGL